MNILAQEIAHNVRVIRSFPTERRKVWICLFIRPDDW